nr:UDP-3-O-(3-hydroxymyristoyl)glucosamine N-acyltransferase [Campylobacter sp.]
MKLSKIYEILWLEFSGDDIEITAINSLQHANETQLSYCDSEKNAHLIQNSKAAVILVTQQMANLVKTKAIIVENPHLAFAILSKHFSNPLFYPKTEPQINSSATIMPNVYIGSNVKIGANSVIMAGAYIGDNVEIGNDCVLHPNVVIYNNSKIGNNCVLNANCVIGSDGFGFAHTKTGEHIKIYHNGWVEIGNHVEIGACSTIDRGVFDPTIIEDYAKIDNLVQVAHNCKVGYGTILVSQVGLAGSTKIGRNVVMGGQAGTAGHLEIGDFAQIAARGGVSKNLQGGKKYAGYPIMELNDFFKMTAKMLKTFGIKR